MENPPSPYVVILNFEGFDLFIWNYSERGVSETNSVLKLPCA